ncbi:MAG: glycoside hydrolase [Actinobacteria bacterium]|nr:glycoside hydrolase [Actinomycetota bacterium]
MANPKRPAGTRNGRASAAADAAAAAKAAAEREETTRRRRLLARLAVAALVAGGGVTYLTQATDGPSTVAAGSSKQVPPADFPDPGLVHVHGLGVDPADGALYAATHAGLFTVPRTGKPVRIANRYQDTMGFTIAGPGAFLGSGHPDAREDNPPRLGLIESTDRGQSWTSLSLRGKADFHALHAAHGQVYGYDATSGTFMVSGDRRSWDRRAQVPMRDFTVSPTSPDVVLATTEQGLARSTDGGRTFAPVPGAPALAILAWPAAASLYGIGADGTVHRSADGGATWAARGTAGGEPEAMTVDARDGREALYVAVSERGIVASTDGGATFTTRYAA